MVALCPSEEDEDGSRAAIEKVGLYQSLEEVARISKYSKQEGENASIRAALVDKILQIFAGFLFSPCGNVDVCL